METKYIGLFVGQPPGETSQLSMCLTISINLFCLKNDCSLIKRIWLKSGFRRYMRGFNKVYQHICHKIFTTNYAREPFPPKLEVFTGFVKVKYGTNEWLLDKRTLININIVCCEAHSDMRHL